MKVLFDHQAFTYQNWGGVSKSFCELLKNRPSSLDYEIAIAETSNVHLIESNLVCDYMPVSRSLQSFRKNHSFLGREKIYNFLGRTRLLHTVEEENKRKSIKKIKEGGFDVFHATFFDDYFLPYLNGKPFVLTVHDLMPELFGWRKEDPQIANKPILLEKAAAITVVSNNTKSDLCRLYNVPESNVHVIYHGGPDRINRELVDIIGTPYFLYVGRRDGYKNFKQTLHDFADFHRNHPDISLICTGYQFSEIELRKIQSLGIDGAVRAIFVDSEELNCLYAHAIAFVYPSLYEGFGMPILEAFACGCPVLLNKKSCFPEIGGDAALFFESEEVHSDLPSVMEVIMSASIEERENIIDRGYRRLSFFSWKESARQLESLYKTLV